MKKYNLNTVSGRASKLYDDARNGLACNQEAIAFRAAEKNNATSKMWGLCMALAAKGLSTWSNVVDNAAKQVRTLVKMLGIALAGGRWSQALASKDKAAVSKPVCNKTVSDKPGYNRSGQPLRNRNGKAIGNGPDGWCDLCQSHCYGDCRS
jgi:hypothetical protein